MSMIFFECPNEVLQALAETPEQFARESLMLVSVKLYELGRLSSGQAAHLAGMNRVAFLDALKEYQVSVINLTQDELAKDFARAGNL